MNGPVLPNLFWLHFADEHTAKMLSLTTVINQAMSGRKVQKEIRFVPSYRRFSICVIEPA